MHARSYFVNSCFSFVKRKKRSFEGKENMNYEYMNKYSLKGVRVVRG